MTGNSHPGQKQRVLIAGGGVACLEAALAMQSVPASYDERTIGRYPGPLLDSLTAAESAFRSTPSVRKASHG